MKTNNINLVEISSGNKNMVLLLLWFTIIIMGFLLLFLFNELCEKSNY